MFFVQGRHSGPEAPEEAEPAWDQGKRRGCAPGPDPHQLPQAAQPNGHPGHGGRGGGVEEGPAPLPGGAVILMSSCHPHNEQLPSS